MPTSWVQPNRSPLGALRSSSSVSGRLPAGPAAVDCTSNRAGSDSTREANGEVAAVDMAVPGRSSRLVSMLRLYEVPCVRSPRATPWELERGPVHFLDLTLPTLAENLALDEALLLEAEDGRGGEVLHFWEWPSPAVVLGAGCRLADDVDEAACRADGVPVLRRASGGGTVLLGPGCLCYSLVLAYARAAELRDITASYGYILGRVAAALRGLLPDAGHAGTSDLASGGRK